MKKTNINDLAKAVMSELENYKNKTTENIKKTVIEISDETRKDIKANAPKKTGKYAKGWKKKIVKETGDSIAVTVYTPSGYRLSHLLEYGHAKRNGGRVKAMPHIKPAEEEAIKKLEKEIIKNLQDG
ncbi:HK97 gp10 family phage protein [Ligilactobacillus ceti]|nr:HK97 gp10 family phage protein [Ligilactobacillus ceti]